MAALPITEEETAALVRHLREAIDYDSYPLALRLDPLKSILAKLDPPATATGTVAATEAWHGAERRARSTKVNQDGIGH